MAIVATGLLSAFTYPLVREGYHRATHGAYLKAQQVMLEHSLQSYLKFNPAPTWGVETPTKMILADLSKGWDRSLQGQMDSFLPANESVESLAKSFRVMYRGPESYKVVALVK